MTQALLPMPTIARKLNLPENLYETLGTYGAKLKLDLQCKACATRVRATCRKNLRI